MGNDRVPSSKHVSQRESTEKETAHDATILQWHLVQGRGGIGKKECTVIFPPNEDKQV